MLKNDYRRALIMLRALAEGVSGYVRLARRTLIGTLQFTINGAARDEALYALMLYAQNGLWYACKLDKLGPARYGQAGMVYRFDPRNICGRELDGYSLIAVASAGGGACELLLAGYLNGSVETDWPQVRQAVCQALAAETGAAAQTAVPIGAPIPKIAVGERPTSQPAAQTETAPVETVVEAAAEAIIAEEAAASPPVVAEEPPAEPALSPQPDEFDTPASAPPSDEAHEAPPAPDDFDQPAQSAAAEPFQPPAPTPDVFDTPAQSAEVTESAPTPAAPDPPPAETPETAGDALPLDIDRPWPKSVEPLRQLFVTRAASQPFEAEGFVLVKAPIAAETGLDHCVVGISAADGQPDRVLYGLPARWTPTPPAGLEGYEWRGDGQSGYWVIVRPVE